MTRVAHDPSKFIDVAGYSEIALVRPGTVRLYVQIGFGPRPFRVGRNPRGKMLFHRNEVVEFYDTQRRQRLG